jgi:hypothetical protein
VAYSGYLFLVVRLQAENFGEMYSRPGRETLDKSGPLSRPCIQPLTLERFVNLIALVGLGFAHGLLRCKNLTLALGRVPTSPDEWQSRSRLTA